MKSTYYDLIPLVLALSKWKMCCDVFCVISSIHLVEQVRHRVLAAQNLNEKTEIDAKHADLKSHKLIRTTIPKESFVQYCFTIKLPVIFVFQVPGR